MTTDLTVRHSDIISPLNGIGLGRFSDFVSGSLFAPQAVRNVVAGDKDLGIDTHAFRSAPSAVFQFDVPGVRGKRLSLMQWVGLIMLSLLVVAVAVYSIIYATHPYMVSGLVEHYLLYLPLEVDYD